MLVLNVTVNEGGAVKAQQRAGLSSGAVLQSAEEAAAAVAVASSEATSIEAASMVAAT